ALVTVALAASKSWAMGLPNRLERPTTTASAPSSSTSAAASSSITPSGVQGLSPTPFAPCDSSPALTGVRPSTSLAGSMSAVSAAPSRCAGTGSCISTPDTCSSALSAAISPATASKGASAPRRRSIGSIPTSMQPRCLPATYTADAGDHALAEGRVHDVLAQPKRAGGDRLPADAGPARAGRCSRVHFARAPVGEQAAIGSPAGGERIDAARRLVEQLRRDLVKEAAAHAGRVRAEDGPP